MDTPSRNSQVLDAGPRGASNMEAMSALSTGKKGTLAFFKGDEGGTAIGSHKVFDFSGVQQHVGMVQTWNQCEQMLLTSEDKPHSVLLMDTETGAALSELSLRRQQKNWNLAVESITPMQKFEQYKQASEYNLFGLGDGGKTVFALSHDARAGKNVEEFVIRADSSRKYKSYTFTCHAQTKGGYLAVGRTDGGVALYDAIMQSENASCVLDGMPGPVTSIDVAADGSMVVWTTSEFLFFAQLNDGHWEKAKREPKPAVLQLAVRPADLTAMIATAATGDGSGGIGGGSGEEGEEEEEEVPNWMPVRFDAGTARDEHGLLERQIISYCGATQVRWSVKDACDVWEKLDEAQADNTPPPPPLFANVTAVGGSVFRHVTVKDDLDVVALEGEIVKSLRF